MPAILNIYNGAYCKLENWADNLEAHIIIDKVTSCDKPGAEYSMSYKNGMWDGRERLNSKTKGFPLGLLPSVELALKDKNIPYQVVDNRPPTIQYELGEKINLYTSDGELTLRDYQYDAVTKCLKNNFGIVNIATNGGKTEIACGVIGSLINSLPNGKRILFLTGSKEIFHQTKSRIEERLKIDVGMWGDGKVDIEHPVVLGMIPTIAKKLIIPKKLNARQRTRLIGLSEKDAMLEEKAIKKELKEASNYAKQILESAFVVIGDEAHHASSDTWYQVIMACTNSQYRIGLTGTIDKSNPVTFLKLRACTGDVLVKVSNEYLIEQGHSAKPIINMISYNSEILGKMSYQTARSLGIINNLSRNLAYTTMIRRCIEENRKCLVIVNEVEHGELIQEMLSDIPSVVFVNGNSTSIYRAQIINDMKKGLINVTIATSIFDEGVDISGINAIFLMAGGKSMRQLLQRIGRGLRKKADGSGIDVYDSMDLHQEYLAEHTLCRYNVYVEEGFEVRKTSV